MAASAVDLDLELLQGTIRDRMRNALRYAVLAPSTHNTQPWLFRLDQQSVEVFADRSRSLPHIDPDDRELTMSVGAAVEHLRIALASHLMRPEIELLPDPNRFDLMARVACLEEGSPEPIEHRLFHQIRRRHTVRGPMTDEPIPQDVLRDLERVVNGADAGVLFVGEGGLRERLGKMIRLGDDVLHDEPAYRREFAQWVRSSSKSIDGIPVSALGLGGMTGLVPWTATHLDVRRGLADRDAERVREASSLAVLCSREESAAGWLAVGMAVARLTLLASHHRIRCSFFLQPIQMPGCRQELKKATGAYGFPQIVLRLGYAEEGDPTPRRPLEDVLVERRQSRGSASDEAAQWISKPTGGPTQ